ncbi:unnamed protein product [Prorocentrum cordatum]|uniref:Uncharacterized protein n=1 Tax=Prorocentrum cordatum TaxID=2364126 RepID=A0ABN9SJV8_9DINO|nr:unnamed protein product [Polarella glacialis]
MWSTENSRRSAGSPAPAVSLGRRALACARGGGRALGARRLPEATRRGGRSAGAPRKRHVRCQRSGKEGERERGERNKEGEERKRKRERERECERRLSPQLTTAPLAPQTARRHSRGLHVTRPGRRGSVQQGDAEASPGAGKARMAARWWHRTTVHAPVRREGPHQLAGTRQHWRWCPDCRRLRSPSRRPARGTTRPGPRPHWPRSTRGARARRAPCGGGRRAPPRRRAPPGRPQARGRANLATGAAGRPPPSWSGAREDVRLWRPGQAPPLARARAAEGTPRRTPPPPLGRGGPRTNGFCGTVRVVLAWPTHI